MSALLVAARLALAAAAGAAAVSRRAGAGSADAASPAGAGASPPRRPATPPARTAPAPPDVNLGVPLYPGAQFLTSYDAGRGQRFYIFGTTRVVCGDRRRTTASF